MKTHLGVHGRTWIVLFALASALLAQWRLIGPYYWSGSPFVSRLVYGGVILVVAGAAVELHARATGTRLQVNLGPLVLALAAGGIVFLINFIPCDKDIDYMGNPVSCYGIPGPVAFRTEHMGRDARTGELKVASVSWDYQYREMWGNVAVWLAVVLCVTAASEAIVRRHLKRKGVPL